MLFLFQRKGGEPESNEGTSARAVAAYILLLPRAGSGSSLASFVLFCRRRASFRRRGDYQARRDGQDGLARAPRSARRNASQPLDRPASGLLWFFGRGGLYRPVGMLDGISMPRAHLTISIR